VNIEEGDFAFPTSDDLSVVLNMGDAWSFQPSQEHRVFFFQNNGGRISRSKSQDERGNCRKLHPEEFPDLSSSSVIIIIIIIINILYY
jgi:hypothetical protein